MNRHRILIVDDEAPQRETLAGFFGKQGYETLTAGSGEEALELVRDGGVDLVLTDLRMPGLSGSDLLEQVEAENPLVEVIVMTAYGTIESAVAAMRRGAFTYVQKPVDLESLQLQVQRALEHRQLARENRELRARAGEVSTDLVAASSAMREVLALVARAAPSRASVLLLGESGTGKEVVARAVHAASSRPEGPFVPVNIAALPETLLESELFGHEKGAFTGAAARRTGTFERAAGGTLFIDEVGDMPPSAQVKLLRVLQEGVVERVGGGPVEVDVRIVAATNRDLDRAVEQGQFREDLFYRLNVIRIDLPPLRARRADIPPLVERFVERFATRNEKLVKGFERDALDRLMRYGWPGNVRELENVVESAVVLARGEWVSLADLPAQFRREKGEENGAPLEEGAVRDPSLPLPQRVEAFERRVVLDVLEQTGGNRSEAARRLGMSEKAVRYRLKRWGLEDEV